MKHLMTGAAVTSVGVIGQLEPDSASLGAIILGLVTIGIDLYNWIKKRSKSK